MKTYETIFIFKESFKDDALDGVIAKVNEEIVNAKGTVINTEVMGKRAFARTMSKQTAGQYVRIDFKMEPANLTALQGRFKMNQDVFRYQVVVASTKEIHRKPAPKREVPASAPAPAKAPVEKSAEAPAKAPVEKPVVAEVSDNG